jgi:hydroxymethylpyrimidine/phosphomethylpyrimidine kinase
LTALGCYATTAITGITSQNTQGIFDVFILPVAHIQSQIKAILDDINILAVKIGMLPTAEGILAISQLLQYYNTPNIVLDTIMMASSGRNLLDDASLQAFKQNLIPIATLITPNIPEAETLLDVKITTRTDVENALKALQQLGCDNVLLKGGHQLGETCTDTLLTADGTFYEFSHPKIASRNTHGTGCTLSSAIAAYLAKGESLPQACEKAGQYVHKAIVLGAEYVLGKGNGPLMH